MAFHEGKLYITVNGVRKGNGVAIGTVEETIYHNIVLNLTNCVSSNDAVQVEEHGEYTTVISAKTGYVMNLLTVTMDDEALTPDNGTIHITDVTGEIQITASAIENTGEVDLSGIVDWYKTEVQDAVTYVSNLGTSDWVHHVVTTDLHYTINCRNSMAIVKSLMGTGLFDKHMLLGDITDNSNPEDFQSLLDDGLSDLNDCTLFTLGNHDWQKPGGVRWISNTEYKNAIMPNVDVTWVDADNLFYYYDDTHRKIRYIGINCGDVGTTSDQIVEVIHDLGADWTFFILCHYSALDSDANKTVFSKALNITNKLLPGYILCDATFGGWICGHHHLDHIRNGQNDPFPQATLDCDTNIHSSSGATVISGWTSLPRETGTASEHAVTIMSINAGTSEVKFYRIGAYQNNYGKEFGYQYGRTDTGWAYGRYASGTYTLLDYASGWVKMRKLPLPETAGANGVDFRFTFDPELFGDTSLFISVYSTPYSDCSYARTTAAAQINNKLAPNAFKMVGTNSTIKAIASAGLAILSGTFDGFTPDNADLAVIEASGYVYSCVDTLDTCTWYDQQNILPGGTYQSYESRVSTSAIKVKPSTKYSLHFDSEELNAAGLRIVKFAANLDVISNITGSIAAGGAYTFTTDANCEFISLAIELAIENKDALVLEEVVS